MSIRRLMAAIACLVPMMGASLPASAVTVAGFSSSNSCKLSDVSAATGCIGMVTNSGSQFSQTTTDSVSKVNANAFFGFSDWIRIDRINASSTATSGANLQGYFTTANFGTYAVSAPPMLSSFMLVLKGQSGYAAYALSAATGYWTTAGLMSAQGNQESLQVASLYARAPIASVPVPAAGLLLLSALMTVGAGIAIRQKKRTA